VIRNEDIQIGVQRRVEVDMTDVVRKGVVTFYNDQKGYGFIRDSETKESVFVHANGLLVAIKENDKVTYTTEKGPKGMMAVGVKADVPVK
ncbi:MAG: cold shock domain-containing protein, partial [Bacteroidetes bacterium]|nr:cold shock domain-containing protein [Bacteroidota bacterium]